jgi:hypothetical protein
MAGDAQAPEVRGERFLNDGVGTIIYHRERIVQFIERLRGLSQCHP